jgi:hypothetical protein
LRLETLLIFAAGMMLWWTVLDNAPTRYVANAAVSLAASRLFWAAVGRMASRTVYNHGDGPATGAHLRW